MRKLKPREGKGLAGSRSHLVTAQSSFCSTSTNETHLLPEQEEEAKQLGEEVEQKIILPRSLASSGQGTDRRKVRVLDEGAPLTPACTRKHNTCMPFPESRLVP